MEDKPKKKTNGKRNRQAGHDWEREVIRMLCERGIYPKDGVVTCRSNSKRLDDAGIDLMHLDEATQGVMRDSIQTKTSASGVPYMELLERIVEAKRPGPVIFLRRTSLSDKGKQMEQGQYAITFVDRYLELMACEKFVHEMKTLAAKARVSDHPEDQGYAFIYQIDVNDKLKSLGL